MKAKSEFVPECCPVFDPDPWDEKLVVWENKKFIKENVTTLFYMPLNFGSVMKRFNKTLEREGATMPDSLCLSEHSSKWNMNLYLSVDKEINGARNVSLSGTYFCKVYEGPFRDTGNWCKDFENILKTKGYTGNTDYMWYTTCPKCARKYGKNYVVFLSKIK